MIVVSSTMQVDNNNVVVMISVCHQNVVVMIGDR